MGRGGGDGGTSSRGCSPTSPHWDPAGDTTTPGDVLPRTVYIGGIDDNATREQVLIALSSFGLIQQYKICGRFGFFEYDTSKAANSCISKLNGNDLCGRTVKVVKSESAIKDGCCISSQERGRLVAAAIEALEDKDRKFQNFCSTWDEKQRDNGGAALPPPPPLVAKSEGNTYTLPAALLPRAMGPHAAALAFPGADVKKEPVSKSTVHVSGFDSEDPTGYRDYALLVALSLYGTVQSYQICGHYGFFEYTDEASAQKCISLLDGKKVLDRVVHISLSRTKIGCPKVLTLQEQDRFQKAARDLMDQRPTAAVSAGPAGATAAPATMQQPAPRAAVMMHPTVKPLPVGKDGCASTVHIGGIDSNTPISEILTALFVYGNIHQYRLCGDPSKPARYGFFEFATEESAQGCTELNGRELFGRTVYVTMSTRPIEYGVRLTGAEQIHYFNNRMPPEPEVPATASLKQFAGCWTVNASSPPRSSRISLSPPRAASNSPIFLSSNLSPTISPPISPPLTSQGPSRERSPYGDLPPQLIEDDDGISAEEVTPLKKDDNPQEVSF